MRSHHDLKFSQFIPIQYHFFQLHTSIELLNFSHPWHEFKNSVTVDIERLLSQPLTNNHCHFLITVPYSCYSFSQNVCCIQYAHSKAPLDIPFVYLGNEEICAFLRHAS